MWCCKAKEEEEAPAAVVQQRTPPDQPYVSSETAFRVELARGAIPSRGHASSCTTLGDGRSPGPPTTTTTATGRTASISSDVVAFPAQQGRQGSPPGSGQQAFPALASARTGTTRRSSSTRRPLSTELVAARSPRQTALLDRALVSEDQMSQHSSAVHALPPPPL
jgi:hypothetical protein